MLFNKYYKNSQKTIPYFWMPKYTDAVDSSARTLQIYKNINNIEKEIVHKKIL